VVALVGDNGAGKSTLVKTIAGTHQPDHGAIRFEGTEVKIHTPGDATRLGIETVYQDLALCDNLDVVANMFLGRELGAVPHFGPLSELDMEKESLGVLKGLKVTTIQSVRTPVASLSGGQRQSVAISRAVMWNSKVVILDEPTAALDARAEHELFASIRALLRDRSVLLISHRFSSVREADRIYVLHDGAVIEEGTHESLMERAGLYAEMFLLQATAYR
jgi:ABC-type sugar transport system ATPase subunit